MTIDENKIRDRLMENKAGSKKEWILVSVILVIAITIASLLFVFKPEAEKKPVKDNPPFAEFVSAEERAISIPVFTQGSINAKTHIKLIAEVNGRVTHLAKLKLNGGFFNKDELLLQIDDSDYRLAITKAEALVAAAKQQLARVKTEAAQARFDLKQIGRSASETTPYALREPHLAEAKANFQAAQADLKIAQLQLQRTRVLAPFDGRVVSKQVDIGQYVSPGTLLADIYSTEMVEVRLPLRLEQIELLGITLRNNKTMIDDIDVELFYEYAGKQYKWTAQLSHTEGELDARNRLIYAVAEIQNPYQENVQNPDSPPLTPGMFVKAVLSGKAKSSVIKLPRSALRYGSEVWVIDNDNELQKKQVKLYARDKDFVYIESGLKHVDRVITNVIDFPLEGMKLLPHKVQTKRNE